jgi:hypothetical protein
MRKGFDGLAMPAQGAVVGRSGAAPIREAAGEGPLPIFTPTLTRLHQIILAQLPRQRRVKRSSRLPRPASRRRRWRSRSTSCRSRDCGACSSGAHRRRSRAQSSSLSSSSRNWKQECQPRAAGRRRQSFIAILPIARPNIRARSSPTSTAFCRPTDIPASDGFTRWPTGNLRL